MFTPYSFYIFNLTKNVCELIDVNLDIATTYDYTPFGSTSISGTHSTPFQFSSEFIDSELGLVYYNYRHYNLTDGRWLSRDPIAEQGCLNLYCFIGNKILTQLDVKGLRRLTLTYDFAKTSWLEKLMMPWKTKYVNSMNDAITHIKKTVGKYDSKGENPCNCIEKITLTDHSGVPGLLRFGDGFFDLNQIQAIQDAHNKVRQSIALRQAQNEIKFLTEISSYLCEESTVDFVQCNSGEGPQGELLLAYLKYLFPKNTNIILYNSPVKWVWGGPKCVKK